MRKDRKPNRKGTAVDFAPHIGWIVEEESVRVFQAKKGELLKLKYPEAAVWDLISRYSQEADIIPKLAAICELNAASARTLLRSCLRSWLQAKVLLKAADRG